MPDTPHSELDALLTAAFDMLSEGDHAAAEARFRAVIRTVPGSVDACIGLGVSLVALGRPAEAVDYFRLALESNAESVEALVNLGNALTSLHRPEEAVGLLESAVALAPDCSDAYFSLGLALSGAGRDAEASQALAEALRLDDGPAESHIEFAAALDAAGRPSDAIARLERAVELEPERVPALLALGVAHFRAGRVVEALADFDTAVAVQPDNAGAWKDRGNALARLGRFAEAEACHRKSLALMPDRPDAYCGLGNALQGQRRLAESLAAAEIAVALDPSVPLFHVNLAVAREALRLFDPQIEAYRRAVTLDPNYADAHYFLGMALLAQGDFEEGWREYEWRLRGRGSRILNAPYPRWNGEPMPGRTLLVTEPRSRIGESGFGDVILFSRFLSQLKRVSRAEIALECPSELCSPLGRVPGVDRLVPRLPEVGPWNPGFDAQIPLLSLPFALRLHAPEDVTQSEPYLAADPARVAHWKRRLAELPGRKVALRWGGNPVFQGDPVRSCELSDMAALAAIEGVTFISVQTGDRARETESPAAGMRIVDVSAELTDFGETAALLTAVEATVTTCTAVANLAGALFVPTIAALSFAPDWRWGRQDNKSIWYPWAQLVRQPRPGDWKSVFDAIEGLLRS